MAQLTPRSPLASDGATAVHGAVYTVDNGKLAG
jgi:hypothetical protein